jgi:hypothetical protein
MCKIVKINNSLPKTNVARIQRFETEHNISLPKSFVEFLLEYNGGQPEARVFPIVDHQRLGNTAGFVQLIYGLDDPWGPAAMDIEEKMEVYLERIPSDYIPIANDVGGNLILLCVKGAPHGEVYFWDHGVEEEIDPSQDLSASYYNVAFVAKSFDDFLNQLRPEQGYDFSNHNGGRHSIGEKYICSTNTKTLSKTT